MDTSGTQAATAQDHLLKTTSDVKLLEKLFEQGLSTAGPH